MNKGKILVVQSDPALREELFSLLDKEGYTVVSAKDGSSTVNALKKEVFDAILTDMNVRGTSGIELFKKARAIYEGIVGIVVTGSGSTETAVQAVKEGMSDYLSWPCTPNRVLDILRREMDHQRRQQGAPLSEGGEGALPNFCGLIGNSPPMQEVYRLITKAAGSDSTVLIRGETGTGKELVARSLHSLNPRRKNVFVPINCAAIPGDLLESELFGHEKGAFTGALYARVGRFELAHGGTIFLDEIGEMSPSLQAKLLRVLEEKKFERVGGTRTISADVRIIAATNSDLEEAVKNNTFRKDLYYRLNVIQIFLPPLRERPTDTPLLVEHFVSHFNKTKNKNIKGITPEALSLLQRYWWPGNVRELENMIERIAILKEKGAIEVDDLPEKIRNPERSELIPMVRIPEGGISLKMAVDEFESRLIEQALEKAQGVKNRAAQLLRMNRTTLIEKIKKKNIRKRVKHHSDV